MKSIKIIIASMLFTTILSCKKIIVSNETDLIAGATALKTVTNCESAIIGAYGGFATEMDILLNATLSDEVKPAGEFYNAASTHEWTYSSVDVGIRDNFVAMVPQYKTIDRVNRVLIALPVADSTVAGDITKKSRLRGEGLFLRAFSHFQVFRYYCGQYSATGLAMPYMTAPSLDPQARIQMAPYFQKINADLAEAKTLIPSTLTDINRATINAITGLQARVALYMNDWANAEAFSTAYITALPLASKVDFPGIWTDANKTEVAYQIVRTTSIRIGSLFRGTSTGATTSTIGTVTWKPSDKLWNTFDQVNDIRFASYFKNEPLLAPRQTRLVAKYAGTAYGTTNENVNNAKVMRTGEMYLIRAEARAEQGKFTGANSAESDINDLRNARINGYVNVVFAAKQDAIDAIMLERYKELAFEGHRFWDLKRRGLPVARLASDAPTVASQTLPANSYLFLLPIPLTEMQANSALVQNPGYN